MPKLKSNRVAPRTGEGRLRLPKPGELRHGGPYPHAGSRNPGAAADLNMPLRKKQAADYAKRIRENICRHCTKSKVNRPRGLCWRCYYTPGVRDLYPSTSKYAVRGVGNGSGALPLPAEPTLFAPGTEEKVAVMCARALAGTSVFHPADSRYAGDPRPLEWMRPAEAWSSDTKRAA